MSNVSYAWAPITKSEEQDDGTLRKLAGLTE